MIVEGRGFGGIYKESPHSTELCTSGFHLSNIIRPPRPILPRMLNDFEDAPFDTAESGGGFIPEAANFTFSSGFVNSKTGSCGSCIKKIIHNFRTTF